MIGWHERQRGRGQLFRSQKRAAKPKRDFFCNTNSQCHRSEKRLQGTSGKPWCKVNPAAFSDHKERVSFYLHE